MQTSSISTGSRLYDRLVHGMSSDWASKVTGMLLASSVDLSALLEGPPAELDVLVARAISSVDAAALEALMGALALSQEGVGDMGAIPWTVAGRSLRTEEVPVTSDVRVSVWLRAPVDLPFAADISVAQSGGRLVKVGTLTPRCPTLDGVQLLSGSARLVVSLAEEVRPAAPARRPLVHLDASTQLAAAKQTKRARGEDEAGPEALAGDGVGDAAGLAAQAGLRKETAEAFARAASGSPVEAHSPHGVAEFVRGRLEEQRRDVCATAVQCVGVLHTLGLLARVEEVVARGGETIGDGGDGGGEGGGAGEGCGAGAAGPRLRSAGGIFLKLLREDGERGVAGAEAAWQRIRSDGVALRKAQARKRAELRKARSARSSSLAAGRERQAPQASA